MQGIVEIIRCVICIKQGEWPSREEDVEEVDVDKLKEMVHVKDEDIAKLDRFVVQQGEREMKIRKELWFGFSLMAIILATVVIFTPWASFADGHLSRDDLGHLGLLMLALIVVAIMLGFPTAFTLMGMGVFFGWIAYRSVNPDLAVQQILDLMVQRAYSVMSNDVLIAIPLFVFMGYLVERANLIEKLFKSLHLSMARVPGALAVATIVTCAIFATATGIVGAVVTLMGLLALPAMLRAGYNIKLAAGAITAGGCLGILIPPSVLLIVYGATAGVSVVKLYAGAFFPGIMLAALYVGYVIIVAKWKPHLAPPLVRKRAPGSAAAAVARTERAQPQRADGAVGRLRRSHRVQAPGGRAVVRFAAARDFHRCVAAGHVRRDDGSDGCGRHDGAGSGGRRGDRRRRRGRGVLGPAGAAEEEGGLQEPPKEGADLRSRRPRRAGRRLRPRPRNATPPAASPPRRRRAAGRACPGTDLVLDRVRPGHGRPRARLRVDELAAAGDLQDAPGVVLPAGGDDHRRARLDRLRPGHADRGGRRGGVRRPAAGRCLSLCGGEAGQERQCSA